ncbi:MAG: amidohydrolase family protein [Syntrophales bacterium]
MKVIDFHIHIGTQEQFLPWVMEFFKKSNPYYAENFAEKITPEEAIAFFKSNNVDKSVILAEYAPKASAMVTNEYVSHFCKGHEELIPFGCINFEDKTPYEEQARYAVEKLDMKGFKLLPSYQHFDPGDRALFPFYEYVQSLGAPIMFHTGTSIFHGTRIRYADPLLLDEVADEFPNLNIIMEHGGRTFWYDRAQWLITKYRNMHIGIAGIATKHLPKFFPRLEQYRDRFVFGSDWPGVAGINGLIERVYTLPYSTETKEMILYKNAERLLRQAK